MVVGPYFTIAGGRSYNDFSDSRIEKLNEQQAVELDVKKRKELVNQIERILFETQPVVRMYWSSARQAIWSDVKNWKIGISLHFGRQFQDVWIAQ